MPDTLPTGAAHPLTEDEALARCLEALKALTMTDASARLQRDDPRIVEEAIDVFVSVVRAGDERPRRALASMMALYLVRAGYSVTPPR